MNDNFKKIAQTYSDYLPLLTGIGATIMLLLATYITIRLLPLHESINANTIELRRISAKEQSNQTTFEKFETTVTEGFKTLGGKMDDLNTRLSRIEGKLE